MGVEKMKVGLLWYDDDAGRGLAAKVKRAAQRYREKYGRLPNTCYVNPQAGLPQGDETVSVSCDSGQVWEDVRLLPAPNIGL